MSDAAREQAMGGIRLRHLAGAAWIGGALLASGGAQALSPAEQRGQVFVREHCARCHAVAKTDASPLAEAPPFRILHKRYPVEDLAESLAEGITTGHPTMPEFRLDPGQANDLIAYLKTLER